MDADKDVERAMQLNGLAARGERVPVGYIYRNVAYQTSSGSYSNAIEFSKDRLDCYFRDYRGEWIKGVPVYE